jgi:hypothetical protein
LFCVVVFTLLSQLPASGRSFAACLDIANIRATQKAAVFVEERFYLFCDFSDQPFIHYEKAFTETVEKFISASDGCAIFGSRGAAAATL